MLKSIWLVLTNTHITALKLGCIQQQVPLQLQCAVVGHINTSRLSFALLRPSAVSICSHHIPSTLCNRSTVLFCSPLKRTVSPLVVLVKSEQLFHVVKHVIKNSTSAKASLKVPLVPSVGLLVGPKVLLKVSLMPGMSILTVDIKVLEHVVKIKVKVLVEMLPLSTFSALIKYRTVSKLVVFLSLRLIRQCLICC